ncbi:hypothetical protein MMC09_004930 [Bachmanniomyces sp. S44760]|nr:hypothetical protein [Bachmanniomyces sp. S44760]
MLPSLIALALTVLAIDQTAARPLRSEHIAASRNSRRFITRDASATLSSTDAALLQGNGKPSGPILKGTNPSSGGAGSAAWLGSDGPTVNEFSNDSKEDLILILWADTPNVYTTQNPAKSAPLITISLPVGKKADISFSSTSSGAWSAIYKSDWPLGGGDVLSSVSAIVKNTWGEWTMTQYGQSTVDVSMEPNMQGHPMSIKVTDGQTTKCTSDMTTCVFKCLTAPDFCGADNTYGLFNCNGDNQHSNCDTNGKVTVAGTQASGGCTVPNTGAKIYTSFL